MKQRFNRIFSALLAIVLCVGLLLLAPVQAFAALTSGKCGENLSWSFADGHLTITGSGKMTDYTLTSMPPWYEFREKIYYVSLPEGLTTVGDMAFCSLENLTSVRIPSTVTKIGELAFSQCRSMAMLTLNQGLQTIGRSAFEQCWKLRDLRLPDTVTTLGYHAFYDCQGLQYVRLPASVKEMDSGVFAYCSSLARAEIKAPISVLPAWTFYGCTGLTTIVLNEQIAEVEDNAFVGCEQLETVYYGGSASDARQISKQISAESESFSNSGSVVDEQPDENGVTYATGMDKNGQPTISYTNVTQTKDATVSTTVTATKNSDKVSVEIGATIITENGWNELQGAIEDQQKGENEKPIDVNVYVPDSSGVPTEIINTAVNNSNVSITVHTGDGSQFAINGQVVDAAPETEKVHFSYSAIRLASPDYEVLKGKAAYDLKFSHSSDVKMEILIRLPAEYAKDVASLYQLSGKELVLLQSVIVDSLGYAHFYMANIDSTQVYRIGINIPDIAKETVIVPEEYYSEYGITANYPDFTQYAITGPKSSWGLSMKQVTMIMFLVMFGCAVCVGVVMYLRNVSKLKKGYIPDIGEEEDNT